MAGIRELSDAARCWLAQGDAPCHACRERPSHEHAPNGVCLLREPGLQVGKAEWLCTVFQRFASK